MSKKIISFCLWGNSPKYCVGAIRNGELAPKIYTGWTPRFHVHKDVEEKYLGKLQNLGEICLMDIEASWTSMYWRFLPAQDPDCDVFICRDTDSRLSLRERVAVQEWMDSDYLYHIMRDHPHHGFPMLGGMCGFKRDGYPKLLKNLSEWPKPQNEYGCDYRFFGEKLYPNIRSESMEHDEFFTKNPFPLPRAGNEFVGAVYDEKDSPVPEHVEALKEALKA
jgi:hypothetical protein